MNLNNYFIGVKSLEDTTIVNKYINENTNGYGKLFKANKLESYMYNGPIVNGKMNGNGYINFSDDNRFPDYKNYKGNLLNDLFHGYGILTYKDGNVFIGNFANGYKDGHGIMYNVNGDILIDNIWKDDIICGKINYNENYTNSKQLKIKGILYNGNKIKTWIYYRENGTIEKIEYYGECVEGVEGVEPEECVEHKDFKDDKSNTLSTPILQKQLFVHDSGYLIEQKIVCDNSTNENLCNGVYTKASLCNTNISCDIELYNYYEAIIKLHGLNLRGEVEGSLILSVDKHNTNLLIKECINSELQDKIIFLATNLFADNVRYFLIKKNSISFIYFTIDNKKLVKYYDGDLLNNLPHGVGNRYEHENETLKFNGIFENGAIKMGTEYKYNSKDDKNYLIYKGSFKNNIPHGEGIFYNNNGIKIYEGEVSQNKYNGNGISYWDNGLINWNGKWKNGQKHGNGILYDDNGVIICNCTFEYDQMGYIE